MATSKSRTLAGSALLLTLMLVGLAIPAVSATKKTILYNFLDSLGVPPDGGLPYSVVTFDKSGALYGTAEDGGLEGCFEGGECGAVYRLTPPAQQGGSWTETLLYAFGTTLPDAGGFPIGGVVFDKSGNIFGSAYTLFELSPPQGGGTPWIVREIDSTEQGFPTTPVLDTAGNLYSTAAGNSQSLGSVFVMRNQNGNWTTVPLHDFTGGSDGVGPTNGLLRDKAGNLYGMAGSLTNPSGCGSVYELSPNMTHKVWTLTTLHNFSGSDGCLTSTSSLILDSKGNIYGTTATGGTSTNCQGGCGTVFELTPSGGAWTASVLYSFGGGNDGDNPNGVVIDRKGALYGTTSMGGPGFCLINGQSVGCGSTFRLAPPVNVGDPWTKTTLHNFQGAGDGWEPASGVTIGPDGALYGTTLLGGAYGYGTVYRIPR
jgi:hypothetical protein